MNRTVYTPLQRYMMRNTVIGGSHQPSLETAADAAAKNSTSATSMDSVSHLIRNTDATVKSSQLYTPLQKYNRDFAHRAISTQAFISNSSNSRGDFCYRDGASPCLRQIVFEARSSSSSSSSRRLYDHDGNDQLKDPTLEDNQVLPLEDILRLARLECISSRRS